MDRRSFISSALAASAVSAAPAASAFGAQRAGAARTTIIDNKVHLLDARLQGTPVRAIVDTGARVSTLSESLAARLGIEGSGSRRVNTVHGEFRVRMARDLRLEVPGFAYRTGRWAIMPDAYQPGLECVVETSALGAFTLAFSDQSLSYGSGLEGGALMEMRRSPVPVAELSVDGFPLPMVLDTGADLSWIDPGIARQLLAKPGVTSVSFMTVDGPVLRALRVPLLVSGDNAFTEVLLRVRQTDRSLRVRGAPVAGLLGTNVMRFYDWSMSEGYRVVRRGPPLPGRQEWIGLGLDFRVDAQDPGRVVGLAIDGPAAQAGLSVGDRILTLDSVTADPAGDAVMRQSPPCDCIETVTVQFMRAGSTREETVAITTAPMV
jgi:hypothetical protein